MHPRLRVLSLRVFRDVHRKSFSSGNPEGMVLCQPRVKRREGNERRATLGYRLEING